MGNCCASSNVHPCENRGALEKCCLQPPKNSLHSIRSESDIQNLSVKELKDILENYCVDYKGCIEKSELQKRVCDLYWERRKNVGERREEDTCKICWDATVDCVLLECGHFVCCLSCSRKLKDCPICRQFISRTVHVFRG